MSAHDKDGLPEIEGFVVVASDGKRYERCFTDACICCGKPQWFWRELS